MATYPPQSLATHKIKYFKILIKNQLFLLGHEGERGRNGKMNPVVLLEDNKTALVPSVSHMVLLTGMLGSGEGMGCSFQCYTQVSL